MADTDLTRDECADIDELYRLATMGTFYDLLGVAWDAERETIQARYYEVSRTYHPDRFFRRNTGPWGEKIDFVFATVTKAYTTLSNKERRAKYTRELRDSGATPRLKAAPEAAPGDSAAAAVHEIDFSEVKISTGGERTAVSQESLKRRLEKRRRAQKGMAALRGEMRERLVRAKKYYGAGLKDFEEGNLSKAASSLHLAMKFDPKNKEYRELFQQVRDKAYAERAAQWLQKAEAAESYHRAPEAIVAYRKALQYDEGNALVMHRLGMLIRVHETDQREALTMLKSAAEKDPKNAGFRVALGDLYYELGMSSLATREYEAVLRIDPKNADAKLGLRKSR